MASRFFLIPFLFIGTLIALALWQAFVVVLLGLQLILDRLYVVGMYFWSLVRVPLVMFHPLTAPEREAFAWVRNRRRSGRRFVWNGTHFRFPVVVRGRNLASVTFTRRRPETVGYEEHHIEHTSSTVTIHGFLTRWFIPRVHFESSSFLIEPHGCKAGENVVVIYDQIGFRHVVLPSSTSRPRASKVMSAFREGYTPNYEEDMDDSDRVS